VFTGPVANDKDLHLGSLYECPREDISC
jgi:hypothetical protein